MLSEFVATNRDAIIATARAKVSARPAPRASSVELETGVPLFLDQLITTLREQEATGAESGDCDIRLSATQHGKALQAIGFTAAQVIHDYGDICQAITGLAVALDAPITAREFHTFNRCLDAAMAEAVTEFGHRRDSAITEEESQRQAFFAHELRNLLGSSILAFEILSGGSVGIGGSTGRLLGRNLTRMRDLIDRSLAEVHPKTGIDGRERVPLVEFIEEVEVAATIEAKARGQHLTFTPVPEGVSMEIDRHVIAALVANLLKNAFKFTRPGGHVIVKTHADAEHIFLAIEDECGGLAGRPGDLFTSADERSRGRRGLGLSIARQGVIANGGAINVRSIAGQGCIFTVELPRLPLGEAHA